MNKMKPVNNIISFLICLLAVSMIVLIGSYYISDRIGYSTIKSITHANISYNNHSPDSQLKAIKEFSETFTADYKEIEISFNAKVNSISGWNNIFQTAPANYGIRMELAEPSTLGLIIKNKNKDGLRGFYVTQALQLGKSHLISVKIDMNKHLTVLLDNENVLDVVDPNIDYDISEIAVGSGFSKSRPFDGELSNFEVKYSFYKKRYKFLFFLAGLRITSILFILIIPYYILSSNLQE